MTKRISIIGLLCFIVSACYIDDRVYEVNNSIAEHAWQIDSSLVYNFEIKDTTSAYDVFINIRQRGDYEYQNIILFTEFKSPNNQIRKDTLEYFLADDSGKWYGKGVGDIWLNHLPYRKNILLPISGIYSFKITHAMRVNPLNHILDVGLRVQPHKNK